MSKLWHYVQPDGNIQGPIVETQLRVLIESGALHPSDMVWREGMTAWTTIQSNPEMSNAIPPLEVPASDPDKPKKTDFFAGSLGCILTALAMLGGAVLFAAIKRFILN